MMTVWATLTTARSTLGEDEAGLEEAAPKQRGVVHARSKDAVESSRKLKEARADGEERQTTKMTQFLGNDGEKKAPRSLSRRRSSSTPSSRSLTASGAAQ